MIGRNLSPCFCFCNRVQHLKITPRRQIIAHTAPGAAEEVTCRVHGPSNSDNEAHGVEGLRNTPGPSTRACTRGGRFCKFGGLLLAQKSCFGNGLGAAALLQQLNHLNANLLLKNRTGLLRLCPMNAILLYLGACNTEKSLNDARHLLVLQKPCRCRSRTPIP